MLDLGRPFALLRKLRKRQLRPLPLRLPAGERIGEEDAGALTLIDQRRVDGAQVKADLQVGDDERRRHDLEAEDAGHRRLFDLFRLQRTEAAVLQRPRDPVEDVDEKGPVPAQGSRTYTCSAASPSATPRSSRSARSTRATM